jgi:NTE family protein
VLIPPSTPPRIALVLGGGGLKGFAHIGVLQALEERGLSPAVYAGSSIGALIGAAHASGMSVDDLGRRAAGLRRRDLFRLNHMQMLFERMRTPSIYLEEPLRALCENCAPRVTFDEMPVPVLVCTVDVERGTQVVWGLPGLRNVRVADAVYASCALPGFFPPGRVDGRMCIDGGTVDNLPVAVAAFDVDVIIAIDVGSCDLSADTGEVPQGFATIYMRAATFMMNALQQSPLAHWDGPPMILVRPRVGQFGWFGFGHTEDLIREGYRATCEALEQLDACLDGGSGIYPRRTVKLSVDKDACSGCRICAALAPRAMGIDGSGKAFARTEVVDWSPADGDFVRHCPTGAIEVHRVVPVVPAEISANG